MSVFEKYSEKDVMAAIMAAEEIMAAEGFEIDLVEEGGKNCFSVIDLEGGYFGGLHAESFSTLGEVVDRLDTYHQESFYGDYEDRVEEGIEIPGDDFCRKGLIFLESWYCRDMLRAIDTEVYQAMKDKYYGKDGEHLERFTALFTAGEDMAYLGYDSLGRVQVDALGYLVDKSIAVKIMETQSAYALVEYGGKICEVYVDDRDISDFKDEIEAGTLLEHPDVVAYDTYRELIDGQLGLVRDDLDLGLYPHLSMHLYENDGSWGFYLTAKELEYIGVGKELQKVLSSYCEIHGVDGLICAASREAGGAECEMGRAEYEMDVSETK